MVIDDRHNLRMQQVSREHQFLRTLLNSLATLTLLSMWHLREDGYRYLTQDVCTRDLP